MGINIPEDVYDVIIIGGGPAGFTAGLYASRGGMRSLLVESLEIMGQATMTDLIENYPGIGSIGGYELIEGFKKQALNFGLTTAAGTVKRLVRKTQDGLNLWEVDAGGEVYSAVSVIIATGAKPRKLDVEGESGLTGKGVSYCATCDGPFFKDKDIVVVGGGDTAVEEAIFLTRFGRKVDIIHRRDRLRASRIIRERALANDKIDLIFNSVVESIGGKDRVESVMIKDVRTGDVREHPCNAVFVFVGWLPSTGFLDGIVALHERGDILTGEGMKTSAEGVFACGDCCHKVLRQVVTACGDGATAAFSAQQFVEEIKGIGYK